MDLIPGTVQRMINGDTNFNPVLQVLSVKKIISGNKNNERIRIILSDGNEYMQAMLSSQLSPILEIPSKPFTKNTIIKLTDFVINTVNHKKICVVIKCEWIGVGPASSSKAKPAIENQQNNNSSRNNINNNNNNNSNMRPPQPNSFNNQRFSGNNNNNNNNNNRQNQNRMMGGGRAAPDMDCQPISSLSPYQPGWKICVRCTAKDTMREYRNQRGEGKLFGVDLLDKNGGEIRAVMFNEAAEKFYTVFEKDGCYVISRGQVRMARKGFSAIKNDYSITLNQDSTVTPIANITAIKKEHFNFRKLQSITNVQPGKYIDVMGIVTVIGSASEFTSSRTQSTYTRRTITIVDETAGIDVTLWGENANNYDDIKLKDFPVVGLKGCKVTDYGGRSLSGPKFISLFPEDPNAHKLMVWFRENNENGNINVEKLTSGGGGGGNNTPRMNLLQVKEEEIGLKPQYINGQERNNAYFNVYGHVAHITQSEDRKPWYMACPDPDARNAKVVPDTNGGYLCEKNGKVYDNYNPRYILRFCITDSFSNIWVTAFNEAAEKVLNGITAKEAEECSINDERKYGEIFSNATFKRFVFRVRAKSDTYEDMTRVRYDVVAAEPPNYIKESQNYLQLIEQLQNTM